MMSEYEIKYKQAITAINDIAEHLNEQPFPDKWLLGFINITLMVLGEREIKEPTMIKGEK